MDAKNAYQAVMKEVKKRIAGKDDVIEMMFIALLANGHAMLEGVPGVAKTTMTKALANAIQADFKRIQGASDLEPRDILGYTYLDEKGDVQLKNGPIFTNILLIDEINRAPPRTMNSLLEALEERNVSIANSTMPLKKPFIAFATQNPLNIEGTVSLPKVLSDRFLIHIAVGYPSVEEEQEMLRLKEKEEDLATKTVIGIKDILAMQEEVKTVIISDEVIQYITRIVDATRTNINVVMGASPRADISFMQCGKAKALIEGRKEVTIEDIKALAKPVLSHRIVVRASGGVGIRGTIDGIIATMR